MRADIKKLPKGLVELTIEVPSEEFANDLALAAKELSTERPISGFRPGKASYDVVKARFGEMVIYEHALPNIVRRTYVKSVTDNKLQTYGEPQINVTKLAPGNPVSFTATVAVVPKIVSLPDFRKITVRSAAPAVEEKQVDAALKELQRMRTKEMRVSREVRDRDKIVVDMDLSAEKVPLEGGQARNHGIYLDEEYYIPGLKQQVLGLKEGEKKSFTLKFPAEHYQKNLAGRDVDFAVTVKEVYELAHPELDDAFAKSVGQESAQKLRELVRKNMADEAEEKERQRAELELLEKIVEKSKYEDIPETIINAEVERMIHELKHGIGERGVEFDDYLKSIKKTIEDLRRDFAVQAVKRVKTTLVIREIGEKENISVSDAELLEEVQKLLNEHSGSPERQEQIRSDEYQEYLRTTLRNRKVLELLNKNIERK